MKTPRAAIFSRSTENPVLGAAKWSRVSAMPVASCAKLSAASSPEASVFGDHDQGGDDDGNDPKHKAEQQHRDRAPTAATAIAARLGIRNAAEKFPILIQRALPLHQAARHVGGHRLDDLGDI